MRDEYFQVFVDELGEATSRVAVPESSIKRFNHILPNQFLTYWREEGWCEYGNGLFWTVNPEEYGGLADLWLAGTPYAQVDTFHIVARSAFGKLYAWGERNNRTLTISCPNNALVAIDKELRTPEEDPDMAAQVFFSSRTRKSFDFKDATGKGLFEQARKKLGPLRPDEVYGFEPALVAGGANRLENLNRLNLFAHLTLLRQLAGPTIPFAGVQVR